MKIYIKGRVTEVRDGKNGSAYVTLLDTEQGGLCKVTVPGGGTIKIDSLLDLRAVCKPGVSQYGLFLKVEELLKE